MSKNNKLKLIFNLLKTKTFAFTQCSKTKW